MTDHQAGESNIEQLKQLLPEVSRQLALAPVNEVCCAALDEITVGVVIVDDKGLIYSINKFAEILFGYDRKELYNQNVSVLVPEPLRTSHARLTREFFLDPKVVGHQRDVSLRQDLHGRRKDGSLFPVTVDLSPFTSTIGVFAAATVKGK